MILLVSIPTHRRPEGLRACLKSIAEQEGDLPQIEVFVADNDPVGKEGVRIVQELAPDYPFRLSSTLVNEPGIPAVRNAILDEARARNVHAIAMIDDDETGSSKWLVELLKVQFSTCADLVGGPVMPVFEAPPSQAARAFWTAPELSDGPIDTIRATNNCLIDARTLSKIDWPKFDTEFGLEGGSDTEWFRRLKKQGASFAWAAKALTYETVPASRMTWKWGLKRAFRSANVDFKISLLHREYRRLAKETSRTLAVIALSPLMIPEALIPSRRWKILSRWSRACGRVAAMAGLSYREYAERHQSRKRAFGNSADYWEQRYVEGGNSGAGSYNRLARLKADFLNDFVVRNNIRSIVEFGSGDGAQLKLAKYPSYIGVDISTTVIVATRKIFVDDRTKTFLHTSEVPNDLCAELSLSLDVIYHLVEDEEFESYMRGLFDAASRFVVIYSSNADARQTGPHVRHRRFSGWVEQRRPDFVLTECIQNAFPFDSNDTENTTFADFYVYARRQVADR